MNAIKKFFHIEGPYKFERMDLASICMIVNVLLLIFTKNGPKWGLVVAICGLIWDLTSRQCHINNIVMRLSVIAMNTYFLTL